MAEKSSALFWLFWILFSGVERKYFFGRKPTLRTWAGVRIPNAAFGCSLTESTGNRGTEEKKLSGGTFFRRNDSDRDHGRNTPGRSRLETNGYDEGYGKKRNADARRVSVQNVHPRALAEGIP